MPGNGRSGGQQQQQQLQQTVGVDSAHMEQYTNPSYEQDYNLGTVTGIGSVTATGTGPETQQVSATDSAPIGTPCTVVIGADVEATSGGGTTHRKGHR